MPLTGTYTRTLDEKNRIAIPKPLRDDFGENPLKTLYVAPGTDGSLSLYTASAFEELARLFATTSGAKANVRNYLRLFYARAQKVEVDAQGRVRIPDRLAELAGLKREVVLIGVHDHVELWDAERWEEFLQKYSAEFDSLAEQVFEERT